MLDKDYVCVCVFIPLHRIGFSWLKQNNKCNARDQASDVVLRKSLKQQITYTTVVFSAKHPYLWIAF